jgi:aspartyl-tRNA(Asn)/glutamyl-tRNA(Gln) amidotransferase subunit C
MAQFIRIAYPHILNDSHPKMSLSPEQIKDVAKLARLELNPSLTEAYAGQLSNILELVGQLSAAKTEGVGPMAHPLEMTQRLRADEVTQPDQREAFQAIAPAVQDGLYLVPKVIE